MNHDELMTRQDPRLCTVVRFPYCPCALAKPILCAIAVLWRLGFLETVAFMGYIRGLMNALVPAQALRVVFASRRR